MQVELSVNGQEARQSVSHNTGDLSAQYTWIRVFELFTVVPSVSALAGNIPVLLALSNPDPTMDAQCRFGVHANADGTS